MDENQNQQNWGGMNNNQGQGTPGQGRPSMPPPPPPPEITLRTMQSDIESVKQSGGESPMPKPFTPSELNKQPTMELDDLSKEEGMIKPGDGEGVIPPSEPKKSGMKVVILIAVLVLVLAAAAYIGYAYVYPIFAKPAISLNTPPVATQTIPVVETIAVLEVLPATTPLELLSTTTGEAALPESATTTEVIPAAPIKLLHASYLVSQPEMTAQISITSTSTLANIRDSLVVESNNKPSVQTALKEVVLTSELGQPLFSDILQMFLPDLSTTTISSLFEDDFTMVITYDQNGAWLGMVAKLKATADLASAKTEMAKLEASKNLVNLYLQNSGTQSTAGFKDGKANNTATRYVSFSKTGASLNYGWTNNNLFAMSGSYNGMKALLTKLGIQ